MYKYLTSHLFIVTGALSQEESSELTENQKEENVDGQDNADKFKGEMKSMAEEATEIPKKEVTSMH